MTDGYCIFEYLYRDAGNWETHGALLLTGNAQGVRELLRECLEWDRLFIAEQIGVPSLCAEHFVACGEGPSDLDHAYHEFIDLRPAKEEEVSGLTVMGSLDELMEQMRASAGHWDVCLSPNCYL